MKEEEKGKVGSLQVWFYELVEYFLVAMPVGVVYTWFGIHMYLAGRLQSFKAEGIIDVILYYTETGIIIVIIYSVTIHKVTQTNEQHK